MPVRPSNPTHSTDLRDPSRVNADSVSNTFTAAADQPMVAGLMPPAGLNLKRLRTGLQPPQNLFGHLATSVARQGSNFKRATNKMSSMRDAPAHNFDSSLFMAIPTPMQGSTQGVHHGLAPPCRVPQGGRCGYQP